VRRESHQFIQTFQSQTHKRKNDEDDDNKEEKPLRLQEWPGRNPYKLVKEKKGATGSSSSSR
jgi:hypothetical protein